MKSIAVRIKRIIFALIFASTITACTDDDIQDIFVGSKWTLTYINDGSVRNLTQGKIYSVEFLENSFKATTPGGASIDGKWQADGKTREFRCTSVRTAGNISNDTIAQKMLQIFTNATKYSGDTNWLQIKQHSNLFMQFGK